MTDLRDFLTADRPQRARKSIDAQRQAMFDPTVGDQARAADVVSRH